MQGTCYTISEGLSFVSVRGDAEQEREVTAAGGGVTTADIRTIVHATLSPVDLQHLVSDVKVYTASPSRVAVPPAAVLRAGDHWRSPAPPRGPWVERLITGLAMCTRYKDAVVIMDMPQPHEVNEALEYIEMAYEHIKDSLRESCSYMMIDASHKPYPAMVDGVLRTPDGGDIVTDMRESFRQGNNCLWYDCDMASAFSTYFGYTTVQQPEAASVVIPLSDAELVPGKPFATSPGIVSGSVAYSKSAGGLCFDTAPGAWSIGFLLRHGNDLPELDWRPLSHEPRDLDMLVNCVVATTQDEQAMAYFEYTRARLRTKTQSSEFMRQLAQVADVCIRNIENTFGIFSQDTMHRPQLGCGMARHASVGLATQ